MQLVAVKAIMTCGGGRNTGTSAHRVKPLMLDGSVSWTVSHHQFEAVAVQK
jgi:hypothetical protein